MKNNIEIIEYNKEGGMKIEEMINKIFLETKNGFEYVKQIPDKSVNLILTDPPYLINYAEWDKEDWSFTEQWVKECFRILKDDGSFYSFMGWQHSAEFKLLLDKFGMIKNWIIWERSKGRSSKINYKSIREDIFYYVKTKEFIFNEQKKLRPVIAPYKNEDGTPKGWFINEEGERVRWTGVGNIWHFTPPNWSSKLDRQVHPTQKPIALLERIINASSNKNDIILDPFIGSGSTAVACKRLNRNFIGMEIYQNYIDISYKRLLEIKQGEGLCSK